MPGLSAFEVPPAGLAFFGTVNGGQWHRQIPISNFGVTGIPNAPTGIADNSALELATPPTLRTAYSIYSVSLAWGAIMQNVASGYVGNFLAEIALLINGSVRWIGTDKQVAASQPATATDYYSASGVISADLVNPVRLNPRERLSLRLGIAMDTGVTGTGTLLTAGVAAQPRNDAPATDWDFVPSTISYQILDLPGNRSL
jgi:hypothetical protein